MEGDNSEPAKKRRKKNQIRTIQIDLLGLPRWVRKASDEELVEVFKMGVTVKDSIGLNVSFQDKFINDLLTEKFEPMSETIESLAQNVSKETKDMQKQTKTTTKNFQKQVSLEVSSIGQQVEGLKRSVINEVKKMETSLVSAVNNVVAKVPSMNTITTQVGNVQTNVSDKVEMVTDKLNTSIIPSLAKFEKKLDDITAMYSKAPTKGVIGENQVIEILKELKSHTIENVATRRDEKGDIHVTSPKGNKYLIEVKNHTGAISKANIEKFENDVQSSPEFKVGILVSLQSSIAKRAAHSRFQIVCRYKQFFIYVPNLRSDPYLAVWSVLLADELVAINQDNLNDVKLAALTALYEEFKSGREECQKCKDDLNLLKKTVENLEKNLNPLVKIVSKTKDKLKIILFQN